MQEKDRTRYGNTSAEIAQDFAEQLKYNQDADVYHTTPEGRYEAIAYAVRDRIIHQWDLSRKTQRKNHSKRVYYLSLEFLMGRAMTNNIINLGIEKNVRDALSSLGYEYEELRDTEPDAGLGNGGLGRLAACFMDSLATLDIPAYGYGIRYNYGIFRQKIVNGYQSEQPDNWLRDGNPWELKRPDLTYPVYFGGHVAHLRERGRDVFKWIPSEQVNGVAYDTPIVGYGGKTVNTLRLWSATSPDGFSFEEFNSGDYTEAVRKKINAETLSQVLYPNDTLYMGKELRLKQQYFFVSCSLQDIVRRFKRYGDYSWKNFPDEAAIQMNDTHPSLAVPELMRLLIDSEGLGWDEAWDITVKTLGYTNHTLMPEALEKWPLPMLQSLLPRHMEIIYEINRRFLSSAVSYFPMQNDKIARISIIEESSPKMVRMANLAIIGIHSTNGVAALHSKLLRENMFPEFASIYPERFNNKTNGITQRRWLLDANPALASLITEAIGSRWITSFDEVEKLKAFADDSAFIEKFGKVKEKAKENAAAFLKKDAGIILDTSTLIDVQVKRIHEYKRQLLNAFNIVMIYNRLKSDSSYRENFQPITFLFGGKAAPGYVNAKLIIKFISSISAVINQDPQVKDLLHVYFMPDYRVTLAEAVIPATNLSEQISTAGTEASGTGNMKFMVNGALTIGTLDGANVEMAERVGDENIFIFGHTEKEIASLAPTYSSREWINNNDEIKGAIELIQSGFFNNNESGIFDPLLSSIIDQNDRYFLMADAGMYSKRHEDAVSLYRDNRTEWNRKSIINIASSGFFSSDRTIKEYARDIWHVKPVKVRRSNEDTVLEDARKAD